MMKYCKNCEKETERYAWGKCKPCGNRRANAYRKANPEKIKVRRAAYQKANPEKIKAFRDLYREKNKDRDPYTGTVKRCPSCREVLPRIKSMWTTNPVMFDGLATYCRDCGTVISLKKEARKRGEILNLPEPCTGKELRELNKRQKNRCFVCGKKDNGTTLHLDHSHATGRIRGYDPTITDNPTIKRILCDCPAQYLYFKFPKKNL